LRKFTNWSISELKDAIKTLEEAYASGVASASYPGGGNINYTSRDNMNTALRELYSAQLFLQTGQEPKRIRRVIHSFKSGR
jgi:hypothetical protein